MKNVRLVSNIVIEDNATFTLENVRVLSQDVVNNAKLDAFKGVDQSYATVSTLFDSIQQITVDIATSSLV